jgi:hypothetical protein
MARPPEGVALVGPPGSGSLPTNTSVAASALTPPAVKMKSMQCGLSPAGRYSARNVAGQLPSNASASVMQGVEPARR